MSKSIVYSDGACSGNPGPGGWACIIVGDDETVTELGGFEPSTTNNRMELQGVLEAVKFIKNPTSEVYICTDSTYVIRGITQWVFGWKKKGWRTAEGKEVVNQDIWMDLDKAIFRLKQSSKVHWRYVPGHKGIVGNERCDKIAVAFSQRERPYLYKGPLSAYSYDIAELPTEVPLPEMKNYSKEAKSTTSFYLSYVDGVLLKHTKWPDCQARVQGRSGAKFKKVNTDQEAKDIVKGWGLNPSRYDDL